MYPVEIKFPYEESFINIYEKFNGANQPCFAIDTFKFFLIYKYYTNPYYILKFPFYIGLFILSYLLFYFFFKIRNETFLRREKEMMKLQYSSIKNQIDPHFTLNVLNSISGMYGAKKHEEADKYMVRFSRLIQQSLMNSDKIAVSLKEELEFTRNFIEVQKVRFGNCFDYSIVVDEDIDISLEIPRMLIHTFVENAIKHGLLPKREGGLLSIRVLKREKQILVIIEDNGIGRKKSEKGNTHGTGKGIGIVDEILDLYKKLTGNKIKYRIIDVSEMNDKTGTRVEIVLSVN